MAEMRNDGWYGVTLEKFGRIRAILGDTARSAEDRQVALAALLQGVSEERLLGMPLSEAGAAFAAAAALGEAPRRAKVRKTYLVAGWELRVTEARELSVAQWVDFQTYGRDMEGHLADVLSVVLVPKGKKYNEGYDMEKLKSDLLGHMSVPDALAVCFFFRARYLRSMRRILNYWVGWTTLRGERTLRRRALELQAEVSGMLRSL